ncbi:chemotaxis protein CheW [Bdellovibrio bacteriovorus]|uniref:Chemotaxis protein n=1 Tax=Bdellovibrio bacteriovorus str. Tiberius TaxID=1069642 RepID=K7ZE92_BDEBC|nr:chemotaxis protein CheW [Bdellovibrio bacteriovorus]AFY00262.1 chemotaxis protein [Bdellovibrio bacteriovorus str. Tiberius]
MSDFFGDDFTAELKAYFLDSVIKEIDKFIDLTDEKLWRRILSEVSEQTRAWAVDAKTNEFLHLAAWLEGFDEKSRNLEGAAELIKALKTLKGYIEALGVDKTDTADLATRFALNAQNLREILLLHCRSGAQEFAVPILSVIEISGKLPLFDLPERKEGLLGVIPFRGEAVPVVNLQDHGFARMDADNFFYVICEEQGVRFCLQVTDTEDMISVKEADLQNFENQSTMMSANFVHQFFIKDRRSIMVLDLEKLVA